MAPMKMGASRHGAAIRDRGSVGTQLRSAPMKTGASRHGAAIQTWDASSTASVYVTGRCEGRERYVLNFPASIVRDPESVRGGDGGRTPSSTQRGSYPF